ncbi:hypothetical protein PoB_000626100 [Plakobranchus ocellatus]|uniref:Uncharacterized protein n=1 Tax=Plakobranchus ocellatus TaxID=259542 RepID=A0AAV3Y961_9GAST|nr:hypothetical protein PoB_000626100 [Plakobranchus ocellatus]
MIMNAKAALNSSILLLWKTGLYTATEIVPISQQETEIGSSTGPAPTEIDVHFSFDDLYSATSDVDMDPLNPYMNMGRERNSEASSAEILQDPTSDGLYSSTSELDMDAPNVYKDMESFDYIDPTPQTSAPDYVEIIEDSTSDGGYSSTSVLDMNVPNSNKNVEFSSPTDATPPASAPDYVETIHDPTADEFYSATSVLYDNAPPLNLIVYETTPTFGDGYIDMTKQCKTRDGDTNTYANIHSLR